jgi:hypothetical protein
VSPTWDPAYSGTSAELRSLRALQVAEELEQDLKDPVRLLEKAKVEFRALSTAQLQNTLGGLQSTAEAIEAALNNVGIGEPEEAEEVAPGPFTDQQYVDALETIQALVEGAEGLLESAGLPTPTRGNRRRAAPSSTPGQIGKPPLQQGVAACRSSDSPSEDPHQTKGRLSCDGTMSDVSLSRKRTSTRSCSSSTGTPKRKSATSPARSPSASTR